MSLISGLSAGVWTPEPGLDSVASAGSRSSQLRSSTVWWNRCRPRRQGPLTAPPRRADAAHGQFSAASAAGQYQTFSESPHASLPFCHAKEVCQSPTPDVGTSRILVG